MPHLAAARTLGAARGRCLAAAVALAALPAGVATAAPGDPDLRFNGGSVTLSFGADDYATDVAVRPDGKLVTVGASSGDMAIARTMADGSVDETFGTFGTFGRVTVDLGGDERAEGLALQPDGKIVMAGPRDGQFAVARLRDGGALDPTFGGGDGWVTTNVGTAGSATELALQDDGKIVVGGYADGNFVVARYLPDGGLDPAFGSDGVVTTSLGGSDGDFALALALQDDGKILLGGYSGPDFAIVRYAPDGSLDPAFGSGGVVRHDVDGIDIVHGLAVQPDGKVLAAGSAEGSTTMRMAVARFEPDGTPDAGFDGDGSRVLQVGFQGTARDVAVAADGRIVLAGDAQGPTDHDVVVTRVHPDGARDWTFTITGAVYADFGADDTGRALALEPDGDIVVAGGGGPVNDFVLARYVGDDVPPETTITDGPPASTPDRTPEVSFTADEASSTFECQVDGGAFAPCTSPFAPAPLAGGDHTIGVRATDAFGNVDPTPATRSVTVTLAPGATTGGASDLTATSATLNAVVDANGQATDAHFELGSTAAYGETTATESAGAGDDGVLVQATVTGLEPGTTYHYRVVSTNPSGTTLGADRTFTTPAVPAPAGGPTVIAVPGGRGGDGSANDGRGGGPPADPPPPERIVETVVVTVPSAEPRTPRRRATRLRIRGAEVDRRRGRLRVRARIPRHADGVVAGTFRAAGLATRFRAPVRRGRLRVNAAIPREQARTPSGVVTLVYRGSAEVRPQRVHLRAGPRPARLRVRRPVLAAGELRARGGLTRRARGAVRMMLRFRAGGRLRTVELRTPARQGRFRFDTALPETAIRLLGEREGRVQAYAWYVGDRGRRIRGELLSRTVRLR